MAITWDVKITVLDKAEKRVSIAATRTDDAEPENPWSITLFTIIDTAEQKLAAMDFIWEQYQVSLTEQSAVDAIVGELENQAKDNLEARET